MMTHQQLVDQIQMSGAIPDQQQTQQVLTHVLRGLSQTLPGDLCEQIARVLPGKLAADVRPRGAALHGPDALIDSQVFIGSMVNDFNTTYGYDQSLGGFDLSSTYADDDAKRFTQAVFATIKLVLEPHVQQEIAQALPADIASWWNTAEPI